MSTVVIHPRPEEAHLEPTLYLASALQKRGDRVVFLVEADAHERIQDAGFACAPYLERERPLGHLAKESALFGEDLRNWMHTEARFEWLAYEERRLHKAVQALAPDILLADVQRPHATLIAHSLSVPFLRLSATFDSHYARNRPPLWSDVLPSEASEQSLEQLWAATAGLNNEVFRAHVCDFYRGFFREYVEAGLDFAQYTYDSALVSFAVRTDPELVMCAEVLDGAPDRPLRAYAGPCLGDVKVGASTGRDHESPRILCCLDSLRGQRARELARALQALAQAQPKWKFVVRGDARELGESENFRVTSDPRRELLEGASVLVAGGTLREIQESLWAGVPLVVCPQGADQPGNGARVVDQTLGCRVPRNAPLLAETLAPLIEAALTRDDIAASVKRVKDVLRTSTPDAALALIDATLQRTPEQARWVAYHRDCGQQLRTATFGADA